MNAYLRIGRHRQPRGTVASSALLIAAFLVIGMLASITFDHERHTKSPGVAGPISMPTYQYIVERLDVRRLNERT
jgi:hypothetical protein